MDWREARKVLCVRLDAIGDVLMSTPALRALRAGHPERELTLLTSPSGAAIARHVPDVDRTLAYEPPWMKATAAVAGGERERAIIARLRREGFDAAVIFTVYSQSPLPAALLCHLADIPLRLAHCRENPYHLLSDWVPEPEPYALRRHEVQRQLDLVAAVGCTTSNHRLGLQVPAQARDKMAAQLAQWGMTPGGGWVLVHPGATAASRRYPAEAFAAVAGRLVREHGLQVVFSGSAAERQLVERIRAAMDAPSRSLAGKLDLPGLIALVSLAPVLIVNNTGPAHIAAALGTPVVDLYALTNLQHTPWKVPSRVLFHEVPCTGCYKSVCPQGHHDCLRKVRPEEVVQSALDLLASHGPSRWPIGPARSAHA